MSRHHKTGYRPQGIKDNVKPTYFKDRGMRDAILGKLQTDAEDWADRQNGLAEHTATIMIVLVTYMREKMEHMVSNLEANSDFTMSLRNKGNHILSDAEDFIGFFYDIIPTEECRQRYMEMCGGMYPLLDRWFGDMAIELFDKVNAPLDVKRRAMLKYRPEPKVSVKECNDYHDYGYCHGWTDCERYFIDKLKAMQGAQVRVDDDGGHLNIHEVEEGGQP